MPDLLCHSCYRLIALPLARHSPRAALSRESGFVLRLKAVVGLTAAL